MNRYDGGNKKEMSANYSRKRTQHCGGLVYEEGEREMAALSLNRLAREQTKLRLLADITVDIQVCQIEGWDYMEYLHELKEIIDRWASNEGNKDEQQRSNRDYQSR